MIAPWPFGDLQNLSPDERLRALARDPARALEIGKAAEHFVVADLIMGGHRAFLSDQGLPYDVIVDHNGRLIRIQVKSTCFPRNINATGRSERIGYTFNVRRKGKGGTSRLADSDCDILALVALDCRITAYLPVSETSQCVQLMPVGGEFKGNYIRNRIGSIAEFPFEAAMSRLLHPSSTYIPIKERDHLDVDGVRKTIAEWARETGNATSVIGDRLKRGWLPRDAVFRKPSEQWNRAKGARLSQ